MEVRADKFLSGHYAYFVELPERKPLEELIGKYEVKASTKVVDYLPKTKYIT